MRKPKMPNSLTVAGLLACLFAILLCWGWIAICARALLRERVHVEVEGLPSHRLVIGSNGQADVFLDTETKATLRLR